jgi:hypothetical protein
MTMNPKQDLHAGQCMRTKQVFLIWVVVSGYLSFHAANVSASFVKPPFIINVSASGVTSTSATITWSSSAPASSQIFYGTTAAYDRQTTLDPTLVRVHSQTLAGLTPNTLYHYQVRSQDSSGTLYVAGDFAFTTTPNLVQGMISGETVFAVAGTSAIITWMTNTPANSQVEYGTTTSYGKFTGLDSTLATSHAVTVSPLAPRTPYHVRARSIDAAGNLGLSSDLTFTTVSAESPMVLSAISVFISTSTSATINWSTSIPSNSQVDYGTTTSYGSSTTLDPAMVVWHSATLNALASNTLYHYRVKSVDGEGDQVVSSDLTFTTAAFSLLFPQLSPSANAYSGIALANMDQSAATLNLTAFDNGGNQIQGSNLKNPVGTAVNAGAQVAVIVDQIFGPVSGIWSSGWAVIDSSTSKLVGFFLTFDSALSFLDGAGFSSTLLDSFVLPEAGGQDYTKLLLANPNAGASSLTIELVKSDGTVSNTFQTSIQAFATYSADLASGIFPGVALAPSDYVRVTSSANLLSYEYFGSFSKDIAVIAGEDLNAGGTVLYAPQYAVGGPYNSSLSIVNLDSAPGTVTLALFGGNGSQIGATRVLPIAADGKIYVSDPSFFTGSAPTQLTTGYVQVKSSGLRLSGDVQFSDALHGSFTTALPLLAALQQSAVLSHIASDATYYTGLSILNPNTVDATVNIQTYTSGGQLDNALTQVIPAGNRISRLLTEYFPALAGQNRSSGYVKVTADRGIACFGVFGTKSLSVLSAIPAQPVP